jgi:hypothetical protein
MVIGRQVQGSARLGLPAGECVERAQQVRLPRIVQTGEGREVPEVVDPSPCGSTGTLPIQSAPAPPVSRWRSCSSNQHRPVGGPSTHPHLVALVRAGAGFKNGKLIERPDESEVVISESRDTPIHDPDVAEAARPGLWIRVLGAVGLGGAAGAAGTAALADKSHLDPEQPSDEAGGPL